MKKDSLRRSPARFCPAGVEALLRVRRTVSCIAQCGADVGPKAAFCYKCGNKLEQRVEQPDSDTEEAKIDFSERWRQDRERGAQSSRLKMVSLRQKPIPESAKERAWKLLSEMMIVALEHSQMTVKESEDSAEFMMNSFDPVKTAGEWTDFFAKLYVEWPIYKSIAVPLFKLDFYNADAELVHVKEEWKKLDI